jgi:hypothetical protein
MYAIYLISFPLTYILLYLLLQAVRECPCVRKIIVSRRVGGDHIPHMTHGRDIWLQDELPLVSRLSLLLYNRSITNAYCHIVIDYYIQ